MSRLFGLSLLGLLAVAQASRAADLEGIWRQETPGVGVSYWEFTPKGEHTFDAQEYGIGNVRGTARLRDNVLIVHWQNGDNTVKGVYEWRLKGTSGKGKLIFTQYNADFTLGVEVQRDGRTVREADRSTVRFIGK